jgi:hypothetical protein
MKRHANDKQSNADTHCNEPSARLRIHDLDPLYFVVSRSLQRTKKGNATLSKGN